MTSRVLGLLDLPPELLIHIFKAQSSFQGAYLLRALHASRFTEHLKD